MVFAHLLLVSVSCTLAEGSDVVDMMSSSSAFLLKVKNLSLGFTQGWERCECVHVVWWGFITWKVCCNCKDMCRLFSSCVLNGRVIGPVLWFSHTVSTPYEAFLTHTLSVCLSPCICLFAFVCLCFHWHHKLRSSHMQDIEIDWTNEKRIVDLIQVGTTFIKTNLKCTFCRIDRLNNTVSALSNPEEWRGGHGDIIVSTLHLCSFLGPTRWDVEGGDFK